MDTDLFHHGYERFHERLTDGARISLVRELVASVKAHGGCLVVNWHNVYFFGHYRDVYREVLASLRGAEAVSPDSRPVDEQTVIW